MFKGVQPWDLVLMFVLLGAIFTMEMLGVFRPNLVTITQILKSFLPMPLRFMVFAWLGWHFIVSDLVKSVSAVKQ